MSIRRWVAARLGDRYEIKLKKEHGLQIARESGSLSFVYCAEADTANRFTVDDLEAARCEFPRLQFVVLVQRQADGEVYERAEKLGICLGAFGDLKSALSQDPDIGRHVSREQTYLLRRLRNNRHVLHVRRRGRAAYQILRKGGMPPLMIVATDEYELTADGVYSLLEEHENVDVQAIVSTNPSCSGFSGEALLAGMQAGSMVLVLNQLLNALGSEWPDLAVG